MAKEYFLGQTPITDLTNRHILLSMTEQRIKDAGKALADFYVERPVSEAREILQEAFRQITGTSHVHDYADLLGEYAAFLESSVDWTPDRFRHWKPPQRPIGT
jgi:hypothetical protein